MWYRKVHDQRVRTIAVVVMHYRHGVTAKPLSLAVVPFRNLAHDSTLDYQSDATSDEILTGLAIVPGVEIIGRSAAYRYKTQVGGDVADVRVIERGRAVHGDSLLLPAVNLVSLVALGQGRPELGRRLMTPRLPTAMMSDAPYVLARLGDTLRANALLDAMEANAPRPWFTDVARASVRLAVGDSLGALALLERTQRAGEACWVCYIPLQDPAYDLIRSSPRFAVLLRQAGVAAPWITGPRGGRK